ncbi:protein insensitive-like isoform X2 [Alosa sapidissima]|nr:protein insensitive-like isoform X2 [Alosa sapidissima]
MPAGASVPPTVQHTLAAPTTPVRQPAPPAQVRQPAPPAPTPPSASATTICSTNNTDVHIGPSTSITQLQYGSVKWFNAKKATKDLLLAVFARSILASHSYTGKQSNAFRTKAAKPQLNPVKVSDIINYITKRFGVDQLEVKKAISEKCADQEKMEKRRTH